jgi:hypothetical protein
MEPEDQVIRRRRFESQHPKVEIHVQREGFVSTWTASRDGRELARRTDLRWLLDDLEALVSQ